ncbi:MAG: PQQ-binding-like beta-propeller repeat protein [Pirellulaceae bacterium]|nr:PQQ-binding-like beta-propeller repeat protein [Pirellulaceae bacterium]
MSSGKPESDTTRGPDADPAKLADEVGQAYTPSGSPGRAGGSIGPLIGGVLLVGWIVALALGIVILRWQAADMDFAIINVVTLVLGFVLACSILAGFCLLAPLPWHVRIAPPLLAVLAIAMAVAMLKIEGTNGELVPEFRFRWSPPPDRTVGDAVADATTEAVDLTTTTPEDFPQFLGPERSVWLPGPRLASDWSAMPPREIWRRPIGAGWSAFAAVNGYAVTMEQRGDDELVTCYRIDTGELCWVHARPARHETVLGGVGPRSTPTIDQGNVYALGATGILRCLEGASGELRWSVDILERYGSTPQRESQVLSWGRSNSPLVVDQLVVVPAGGPPGGPFKSLLALDKQTGTVVWEAGDSQISYSSPTLGMLAGRRQILSVNEDNITGHDPQDGRVLWRQHWPGNSTSNASSSQVHALAGDRLLISKGYGEGGALFELQAGDAGLATRELWWEKSLLKTKFAQVCVIAGHAYGLSDGILECVNLDRGTRAWKSGRYGHGQILGVGDRLLVLSERGDLVLVQATPDAHRELGRVPGALNGQTWNNLCLYGDRLLIRNAQEAACYQLPIEASN